MNSPVLLLALGFAAGAILTFLTMYFWARFRVGALEADFRAQLALAEQKVLQAEQTLAGQREFLETSRRELENAFAALASAALKGNTEQFLELADQRLGRSQEVGQAELDKRKQAIEELLRPMRETLGKLETRTGEIESKREGAYKELRAQVESLVGLTSSLSEKTVELATALKGSSSARGRWGEIALRNVAELAGMTEHCDFVEQVGVEGGGRPDMTVRLPGGRLIAVDAKAPLTGYLEAVEAVSDADRDAALKKHVQALRGHIRALAGRSYADALEGDVDLVVMFLPGDPFLAAAFSRDPDLQVEALKSKVLVATPTTLVALLRTVAVYWKQRALAENAEQIASVARELYDRAVKFEEHLGKVGKGLGAAVKAYNDAVGSFERRLLPMGQRLEGMGVGSEQALAAGSVIEETPRTVGENS